MQIKNSQIQDIVRHFSARSEKYDKQLDWVNDNNILDMMVENLSERKGRILDLGAGTGAVAKHILKTYGNDYKIIALDICQDMLDQINDIRIETVCSGVEELPFEDDSFDIVISRQCLHYIEDVEKVLEEVNRVLKKDGMFVLAQIVPIDKTTSSDWESVVKIRQPLRKWYFTSEEWDAVIEKHSFILHSRQKYAKTASVSKWARKYGSDDKVRRKYMQKLLSMNDEYKKKYAVCEMERDVTYQSFWYIARYMKS